MITTQEPHLDLNKSANHSGASAPLRYHRVRYYSPTTGRFNRLDPFSGSTHEPQSLHKYLYAHANPVMNWDPTGRLSFSIAGFSTAFGIGAGTSVGIDLFTNVIGLTNKSAKDIFVSSLIGGTLGIIGGPLMSKGLGAVSSRISTALAPGTLQVVSQVFVKATTYGLLRPAVVTAFQVADYNLTRGSKPPLTPGQVGGLFLVNIIVSGGSGVLEEGIFTGVAGRIAQRTRELNQDFFDFAQDLNYRHGVAIPSHIIEGVDIQDGYVFFLHSTRFEGNAKAVIIELINKISSSVAGP